MTWILFGPLVFFTGVAIGFLGAFCFLAMTRDTFEEDFCDWTLPPAPPSREARLGHPDPHQSETTDAEDKPMQCQRCFGEKVDPDYPGLPCLQCWGMEPSCCDGPAGDEAEQPTDPNEENDNGT